MRGKGPATPRRKLPRQAVQARARSTVETIIEAATRVLASRGWAAFNTNAIAHVAGVSIGSVYEYFGNKQAILDAILDRHLSQGEAHLSGLAGKELATLSLDQIVCLLVDGFVDLHSGNPRLHRVLSTEVPISDQQRERIELIRCQAVTLVAAQLAGKVEQPRIKAAMMVDAADALTHRWFVDDLGLPLRPDDLTRELHLMLRTYVSL